MNKNLLKELFQSWEMRDGNINNLDTIHGWIKEKNENTFVNVRKKAFGSDDTWLYHPEKHGIVHKSNCFFSIKGLVKQVNGTIIAEQPILIQEEIGYLGFICKVVDGVLNFLLQAKIEPGNVNKVQISPTIQATKSNFMQAHGGRKPLYLEYFMNKQKYDIIVDQIQSEHSSYFLGKRNRNIIIKVNEELDISPNYMWATLGEIKELLKIDNLVNMDTRTVISCIPFELELFDKLERETICGHFHNRNIFNSMAYEDNQSVHNKIVQYMNDYKMLEPGERSVIDLLCLKSWGFNADKTEFRNKEKNAFKIIYCDVEIQGREVTRWSQPLIESGNIDILGLFQCSDNGIMKYLVKATPEIGCFDKIELGPSVQCNPCEPTVKEAVTDLFLWKYQQKEHIVCDAVFSEEGGRFYKEQSRNVIIEIQPDELVESDLQGYFWCDYHSLNRLIQFNNIINIQLRNLLSLIGL